MNYHHAFITFKMIERLNWLKNCFINKGKIKDGFCWENCIDTKKLNK